MTQPEYHLKCPSLLEKVAFTCTEATTSFTGSGGPSSHMLGILLQTGRVANVKVAVLVQGAAGAGQEEAVVQSAAAIGAHVIPVACEELRGASDHKTAAALKSAFETATEFGPAILLLQNLPALLDSHNPAGQRKRSGHRHREAEDFCGLCSVQEWNFGHI